MVYENVGERSDPLYAGSELSSNDHTWFRKMVFRSFSLTLYYLAYKDRTVEKGSTWEEHIL